MTRKVVSLSLPAAMLAGGFLWSTLSSAPAQSRRVWTDAEVLRIHKEAYLVDLHNDVPMLTVEGKDFTQRGSGRHTDLARMVEGGMGGQFFAAFVPGSMVKENRSAHQCLRLIDSIKEDIWRKSSAQFNFATTSAGILANKAAGKMSALIGIEGGHAIEDDTRLLRRFYELGARYMTLTHTNTNGWCDSQGDDTNPKVKHWGGINALGRQVIAEMNRLGMMVDVSHISDKAFWAVVETSQAPILATHSNARALADHGRNLTDDMIRALARKGGIMGINFSCDFVSQRSKNSSPMSRPEVRAQVDKIFRDITDPAEQNKAYTALLASHQKTHVRATMEELVAQIDHIVKIAGIDHVAVGSDFDGIGCSPIGLDDTSKFPNLTRALLEHGYSPEQIGKIYHGNLVRFMASVESTAERLKKQDLGNTTTTIR